MAMAIYGAGGAGHYIDTGAADAYVLNPVSPKEAPPAYFDGYTITFQPVNNNTTASTVNVNSLGVKDLVDSYGDALIGGELDINNYYTIIYNLSADEFRLASNIFKLAASIGGKKNLCDNGNCEVYQRATSQSIDGYESKDRYEFINITSASQQSITGLVGLRYADQFGNTGTSVPTESYKIRSINAARLVGKRLNFSAWIKSISGTSGCDVTLYYPTSTDDDFNVVTSFDSFSPWGDGAAVTSFVRYDKTFTVPAGCARGLMIEVSRTNTASNAFTQVTGWQLEESPYPTDFEYRSFEDTLLDCLPYYQKTWGYSTAVATATGIDNCEFSTSGVTSAASDESFIWDYDLPMIIVPGIVVYSPSTGSNGFVFAYGIGDVAVSSTTVGRNRVTVIPATISARSFRGFAFHATADTGF